MSFDRPSAPWVGRRSFCLATLTIALAACNREVTDASGGHGASSSPNATSASTSGPGPSATSVQSASSSSSQSTGGVGGAGGAGPASSSSTGVVELTGDVFDPNEVYLFGSVEGQLGGFTALAHWSTPSSVVAGFEAPIPATTAQIRPPDGRLLYLHGADGIREFRCDACPYQGTYPDMPGDNDPVVPEPPCPFQLTDFLVSPEGSVLHHCDGLNGGPWYDASGNVVFNDPTYPLHHLGYGGIALTESFMLVDLTTSTAITPVGFPFRAYIGMRALPPPDAFMFVFQKDDTDGVDGSQEVWTMDRNGVATFVGPLPPLPPGTTLNDIGAAIDGHGAIFQLGTQGSVSENFLIRRTTTGESEIVYDSMNSTLWIDQTSVFVTGP